MTADAVPRAARAFRETLARLEIDREPGLEDPGAFGRRAAILAAADVLWRRQLGRLLSSEEVRQLLGVGTRQAVSDFVKRRRLLAIRGTDGRLLFPAFQFTAAGRPLAALEAILSAFARAGVDGLTIASWFTSPQDLLEDRTPADWLQSGGAGALVIEAARRTASELAH